MVQAEGHQGCAIETFADLQSHVKLLQHAVGFEKLHMMLSVYGAEL